MKKYIRITQRSQALEKEYFADCDDTRYLIQSLRDKLGKSARQWRKDCCIAYAIEKRQRARSKSRFTRLDSVTEYPIGWNRRLDNKKFRVCGIPEGKPYSARKSNCGLDYTPRYRSIGGGEEYEFSERYRKDRIELDKQQQKRGKN